MYWWAGRLFFFRTWLVACCNAGKTNLLQDVLLSRTEQCAHLKAAGFRPAGCGWARTIWCCSFCSSGSMASFRRGATQPRLPARVAKTAAMRLVASGLSIRCCSILVTLCPVCKQPLQHTQRSWVRSQAPPSHLAVGRIRKMSSVRG